MPEIAKESDLGPTVAVQSDVCVNDRVRAMLSLWGAFDGGIVGGGELGASVYKDSLDRDMS